MGDKRESSVSNLVLGIELLLELMDLALLRGGEVLGVMAAHCACFSCTPQADRVDAVMCFAMAIELGQGLDLQTHTEKNTHTHTHTHTHKHTHYVSLGPSH